MPWRTARPSSKSSAGARALLFGASRNPLGTARQIGRGRQAGRHRANLSSGAFGLPFRSLYDAVLVQPFVLHERTAGPPNSAGRERTRRVAFQSPHLSSKLRLHMSAIVSSRAVCCATSRSALGVRSALPKLLSEPKPSPASSCSQARAPCHCMSAAVAHGLMAPVRT